MLQQNVHSLLQVVLRTTRAGISALELTQRVHPSGPGEWKQNADLAHVKLVSRLSEMLSRAPLISVAVMAEITDFVVTHSQY